MKPREPKGALEASVKRHAKRALETKQAYQFWPVQTGYGAATLDCLACVPITITADMVGRQVGVFVAIETKREGVKQVTSRQAETMRTVRKAAGVALMVNEPDSAAIEDQIKWAIRTAYIQAKLAMEG